MLLRILDHEFGVSCYELPKQNLNFAESRIYRYAKKPVEETDDRCYQNKGRPKKTTPRDERTVMRALHGLRKRVQRFLQSAYKKKSILAKPRQIKLCGEYCADMKKGLLADNKGRLAFAKENGKKPTEFWTPRL